MTRRVTTCTLTALVAALSTIGCMKRRERIQIAPDGGVRIEVTFEGDEADFETADALPLKGAPWSIFGDGKGDFYDESSTKPGGKSLWAFHQFAAGEPLPASFAAPDDANGDLKLRFPTTVTTARRADGVYHQFSRTYVARRWGYVRYWQERFLNNDDIRKLSEKPVEELTRDERIQLLTAVASVEAHKLIEFVQAALAGSSPTLSPEQTLPVRQAILDVYHNLDVGGWVDRYSQMDVAQRDTELQHETERIEGLAQTAAIEVLTRHAGYGKVDSAAFESALAREKLCFDVTSQTGGHSFEILVELPGEVVAHNADRIAEDGALVWEFNGEAFRDRPYELRAVSRVAASRP